MKSTIGVQNHNFHFSNMPPSASPPCALSAIWLNDTLIEERWGRAHLPCVDTGRTCGDALVCKERDFTSDERLRRRCWWRRRSGQHQKTNGIIWSIASTRWWWWWRRPVDCRWGAGGWIWSVAGMCWWVGWCCRARMELIIKNKKKSANYKATFVVGQERSCDPVE